MKFNEPIYFKEDLIKVYSDKRKGISYEEVEDLVNSMIVYLKNVCRSNDTYEIDLKSVGVLHKKADYTLYKNKLVNSKVEKLNDILMVKEALNSRSMFAAEKENLTREEIEAHTNEDN